MYENPLQARIALLIEVMPFTAAGKTFALKDRTAIDLGDDFEPRTDLNQPVGGLLV